MTQNPTMLVRDVMTVAPQTVSPHTSVGELLWRFQRHDFNGFPVVDQAGKLCGIVTKLDPLRLLGPDHRLRLPDLRGLAAQRWRA